MYISVPGVKIRAGRMPDSEDSQPGAFLAHLDSDGRIQLVSEHLVAVSRAARTTSAKIGLGPAGAIIGLLHDLGKYSGDFQRYLLRMALNQDTEPSGPGRGSVDHSTAGAQTIWRRLGPKGELEKVAAEILSLCIASHHSGLLDCIAPNSVDNLSRRLDKADSDSHYGEAWRNTEQAVVDLSERYLQDPALAGCIRDSITKLCRIDSNETILRFKVGLLVRFLFSTLIDADRTDTADFSSRATASMRQHGQYVGWSVLAGLLERHLEGLPRKTQVDELRGVVSANCLGAAVRPRGCFTLTVPTGGGKTLASLRFALNHAAAWRMERIIYVSPYTSIIDQNADVVRNILEPAGTEFGSVVLEHHSNLGPLRQTWRSKVLSENWDSPVVFTTAVQLLECLFGAGTRAVRRMHQLANAVIVFDEIQTLPVRCVHLFNNGMNFLVEQCGSTVVLCTATQPLLHCVDPKKGEIRLSRNSEITPEAVGIFADTRRCQVYDRRKPGGWGYADTAQLAISEIRSTGSCLIIVNTKREARSIFKECRSATGQPLFHLSTDMCPVHRMVILEEIKKRIETGGPVICVSTQLIEAGVDISFGSVVRALAGLDSIAQAAGRCNRHGAAGIGRVHVINLVGNLPKTLHDIREAQEAAQRVLDEDGSDGEERTIDLSAPKLIEQYFRYYFFARKMEMDYPVKADQAERNDTLLNMLAENKLAVDGCASPPPIYLRQAFTTAARAFQPIDTNTQGVIVPYTAAGKAIIAELSSAWEPVQQFPLLKRAQRFTVNVFPHILETLQKAHAVHEVQEGTGILYLEDKYYSSDFGLNVEGSQEMEFQNV
jgi:CRISPR-associated endonuclease/helicase Cas3